MFTLLVENFRAFEGSHELELRPLTLLTGENSSGKSSLLAAIAAVTDLEFPRRTPFNVPPYSLGNYKTIAFWKGGRSGRSEYFSLGLVQSGKEPQEARCTFQDDGGAISLASVQLVNLGLELLVKFEKTSPFELVVSYHDTNGKKRSEVVQSNEFREAFLGPGLFSSNYFPFFWHDFLYMMKSRTTGGDKQGLSNEALTRLEEITRRPFPSNNLRSVSVSPVRSRPRRTYDQIEETFSPEGEHIPFSLSSVLSNQALHDALVLFGRESGLFDDLDVKRLGSSQGDPLQVNVKSLGPSRNLIDMGYGVSQVLPLVVEALLRGKGHLLLLQQPEVHLHPRAQAALGSFLARLAAAGTHQFVVETHSDYIIDRVRAEIADKKIKPSAVQLAYVERQRISSKIHAIQLDDQGNLLNPPPGYRSFFLHEEMRVLGWQE